MFDQNMLNDLAKIKVSRKRKVEETAEQTFIKEEQHFENDFLPNNDEDFEEIVYEDENFEEDDANAEQASELRDLLANHEKAPSKNSMENLSEFMSDMHSKKTLRTEKVIGETLEENDFSTDESEAQEIRHNSRQSVEYKDVDGNQVNSRYIGEDGNINVVYSEPGKNVINRKSIDEQRLDNKMDALAGLLSKFKSEEEIEAEENDPNVIVMDKAITINKNLKKIDNIVQIRDNLELKIDFVKRAFKTITDKIETIAKLPNIEIDITSPDYLRALFLNKNLDDMDVARIFTLSLFLENPKEFPTENTYDQVIYLNSQVGAKCKSIDLKRMITYISSETEFNQTTDLVANIIKNPTFTAAGISEMFHIKCREALKILMARHLKNDSMDHLSKINILSIKQEVQMKARNIESSKSLLNSLNMKLKAIHPSLKEQLKKTEEQIHSTEEKRETLTKELIKLKKELTILIILETARKTGGYNLAFINNLPIENINKQLKEYDLNKEDPIIQNILMEDLKDEMLNEILKN